VMSSVLSPLTFSSPEQHAATSRMATITHGRAGHRKTSGSIAKKQSSEQGAK
jgi:hypothetical protein